MWCSKSSDSVLILVLKQRVFAVVYDSQQVMRLYVRDTTFMIILNVICVGGGHMSCCWYQQACR